MGWAAFWQVFAEGAAFATFGYWVAPVMLGAVCWGVLATSDVPLRNLLLGLTALVLLSLVSIASFQVVPPRFFRLLMTIPFVTLFVAFGGHVLLMMPKGGARAARLAWAAANLTFAGRSILFLGAYV